MSELDFGPKKGIPAGGEAAAGLPIRSPLADPNAIGREDDEIERSLRPKVLADFVGQPRVREQLRVFIDAATAREEALDHALFAGPPGLGKCVTFDTMVHTPQGMVPIGSLGEMGGESWQPITRPVAGLYGTRVANYFYDNGEGETLRVTTQAGYRVEGTPNHPLLVRGHDGSVQFRRLSELRNGDEVSIRLGAQVFGSSVRLAVEGVEMPSLSDPAVVPDHLTEDLAQLLGALMNSGRLSPGGDGVLVVTDNPDRAASIIELFQKVFCLDLEYFGQTPLGDRYGQRSPRVATFLTQLGMGREGFTSIPDPIYRAPRPQVAHFLRGIFTGVELTPVMRHRERTVVAHLQLMLANLGIESSIANDSSGYAIRASSEAPSVDSVSTETVEQSHAAIVADEHYNSAPDADDGTLFTNHTAIPDALPAPEVPAQRSSIGFGVTAAGVLVALPQGIDPEESGYRRGRAVSHGISRARVTSGGAQLSVVEDSTVSVAEVESYERGRALTRERLMRHDVRALAVRSVSSKLRPEEMVELVWEPIVSIEPGHAYTCDVSVPDGHTFIGNGIVCHNTTLASVVAAELGSTMHQTSGPALEKKADVAAILTSLEPRDVLFIDEIHRLNASIEEVLYSAMEDYHIDIVLGQGPAARTLRLDLEPFTLVGATTRTGLLTTPLRDRFGLIQRLEYYSTEELQDIVIRSAKLMSVTIDPQAAREIASRSRGTPRIANRLLRRVRDVAQVRHSGVVTLEIAQEALQLVDIDAVGLDRVDRMILEAILTRFGGGPVGLGTLSVAIGEERHTLEDVYEPFLLQRGFIQRTPRGRIITDLGRQHLGMPVDTAQ